MSDLHDLFTLGNDTADGETETGNLFRGSEVQFKSSELPTPPSDANSKQHGTDATAPSALAAVAGIHRAEEFQAPPDPTEQATSEAEGDASESRLMSTIFAKSGVHSVLEHDAIVNSTAGGRKRKVQADPAFIQREARRTAAAAAEQLRRAEQEARLVPLGVPTWTGEYGEAGRPSEPRWRAAPSTRGGRGGGSAGRGGPSSLSILSNLAARQGRSDPNANPNSRGSTPSRSGSGTSTPTPTGFRGKQMLEMLRDFMITHGGVVPTQMLVDHFDHYCRAAPGRSEEFKEMLKLVAKLEKGSAGRGRWVLKDEWRRGGGAARG